VSVAFTKEGDAESAAADLPDRPISPHPNLVTPTGLEAIDAALAGARAAYSAAQASAGVGEDRTAMARATRDLRYWSSRRGSAQLVPPPADAEVVRFGSTVILRGEDGRRRSFQIVGEDEADPTAGSISYIAPLARAVLGKAEGEVVQVGASELEIEAITLGARPVQPK
jgi:transcription elongation GreA/GreB family factor